jgi:hypothetical protein
MTARNSICALTLSCAALQADTFQAPPTPPPMLVAPTVTRAAAPANVAAAAGTQFSIGNPTDEEQLYLELLNRARANPAAEGVRLANSTEPTITAPIIQYKVNLNLMVTEFSLIPPTAPLSFEPRLIQAARLHNQYQFDTAQQTHDSADGTRSNVRVTAAGYVWANVGENVYSFARNVEMGHAGFEIDWGGDDGTGMQTGRGHRENIHEPAFTEVGIGVILGNNTFNGRTVGPMLVTQNLARPQALRTYVTGVAYYDLNGNNFYDLGEGMGGVTVTVDGGSFFAVTTASGGFSVPVTGGGSYTVRFNAPNLSEVTRSVQVTGSNNLKVDFSRAYTAPTITGTATPFSGVPNLYTFTGTDAATDFNARVRALATPLVQGAETMDQVQITTTGTYPSVSTTVFASGAKSFHLLHPTQASQVIQLAGDFLVRANARLDFKSRLGIASPGQIARAQVSIDNGATWTSIYEQAGVVNGTDTSEQTFSLRSGSLAAFAGKFVKVRFAYVVTGGFFSQTDDRFGWYIDDITLVNADSVANASTVATGASGRFQFTPPAPGLYLLDAQPVNLARLLPRSAPIELNAQGNPPTVTLTRAATVARGSVTMEFDRTTGTTTSFSLKSAADPSATEWSVEVGAVFKAVGGTRFTVTVPANGNARFYSVVAN